MQVQDTHVIARIRSAVQLVGVQMDDGRYWDCKEIDTVPFNENMFSLGIRVEEYFYTAFAIFTGNTGVEIILSSSSLYSILYARTRNMLHQYTIDHPWIQGV